jgi:NADH dehydrogenase FAD-containing subunit
MLRKFSYRQLFQFLNEEKCLKQRIVILGAGFAGLQLARRLKNSDFDITLIDQYNFHQFQPLMYQVATGRLEPSSISFPLEKCSRKKTMYMCVWQSDRNRYRKQNSGYR